MFFAIVFQGNSVRRCRQKDEDFFAFAVRERILMRYARVSGEAKLHQG